MPDESDFPGDDPLDRLLDAGQWPGPDPLRLARLQREWDRAVADRRQKRRRGRLGLAAAAVFAAAAVGLWWILAGAQRDQFIAPLEPEPRERPTVAEAELQQPTGSETETGDRDPRSSLEAGRAPNAFELLVLRATENRQKIRRDDPLGRAVQALVAEPDTRIDELVAPLMPRRAVHEGRLLRSIPNASGEQLIAETKILAAIGSSRSVPVLAQLSRSQATRSVAAEGLQRLADSAALAKLASAEPDEQLKREFLTIVLDRGDLPSLALFLDAIRDPRTAGSALAVFEGSTKPPIDSLTAFLSGADGERRATAARLLGRHPDAINRLVKLAESDSTRQAALMALLASDDPQARRFLDKARNHPQMRTALQLAQLQWQVAAWHVSVPVFPEVY